MTERSSIATAPLDFADTVSQIARRMIRCDAAQRDSMLLKPAAKTRSEQNVSVNRCQRISLLSQ
jgi:hypothetical protein